MLIGIDVGSSATKIVGVDVDENFHFMTVPTKDPLTSLFGALGKFMNEHSIRLADVKHVMLTGVGSSYIRKPLYGLPTSQIDEFVANGLSGKAVADTDRLMVVSLGTGTSFVKVEKDNIEHIGGIGMGGGTLMGLSRVLHHTQNILKVSRLAEKGNLDNIDLQLKDVCCTPLPGLPLDATASLFGKMNHHPAKEDMALGLVHMVLQTIGHAAVLATLGSGIKDFVLIGNLTLLSQCGPIFDSIGQMCGVRFIIPEHAGYQTVLGAVRAYTTGYPVVPVADLPKHP